MDKIIAKGLRFQACHGVLPQEKEEKQTFVIDLELFADLQKAGISDDLRDTISYDEVFHQVKYIVERQQFNLIERLAEQIADTLLDLFPILGVEVTVYKPEAPVNGNFNYFAVDISRFRK